MSEERYSRVFTLEEAAEYLEISMPTLKKYVYETRDIVPSFTLSDLKAFVNRRTANKLSKRGVAPPKLVTKVRALEQEVLRLGRRLSKLEQSRD